MAGFVTEQFLLGGLLLVAALFAPLMTNNFFLKQSRSYSMLHFIAVATVAIGVFTGFTILSVVWLLFCLVGVGLHLKNDFSQLFSLKSSSSEIATRLAPAIARGLPFVFSLISAVWFVAGSLDLKLLGYNPTWSFYAALHGSFLGWLFVGCLAFLTKRNRANPAYLYGSFLIFVLFLMVALGIDGVPYLKRIGAIGLSVAVPGLIGLYTFSLDKRNRASRRLASLSLVSILFSMTLALLNEFWIISPKQIFGLPVMVLAHGLLNAVVAVPCFYLAIRFERSTKPLPDRA